MSSQNFIWDPFFIIKISNLKKSRFTFIRLAEDGLALHWGCLVSVSAALGRDEWFSDRVLGFNSVTGNVATRRGDFWSFGRRRRVRRA